MTGWQILSLRGLKRRVEAHHLPAASGREPLDQAAYEMAAVRADQPRPVMALLEDGGARRSQSPAKVDSADRDNRA